MDDHLGPRIGDDFLHGDGVERIEDDALRTVVRQRGGRLRGASRRDDIVAFGE